MRVAVLVKQVPRFEQMALTADGRLQRDGVELEMNPYCRRAVAKGVELAGTTDGACTVFTLGPPSAEDTLREALAWGATDAVHVCDPAFAGSDTLATARALAAALTASGPFDLVLTGLNSVDADTGQVGPQVAEQLDWPFLAGVRELAMTDGRVEVRCEHDDGWTRARCALPAVISCAERLCDPAKRDAEARAAVPAERIRRMRAADLGPGSWGQAGSPTRVGEVRTLELHRDRRMLSGPLADQMRMAVSVLADAGALGFVDVEADDAAVADGWERGTSTVVVVAEPGRDLASRSLLGAAAHLAREAGGQVEAVVPTGQAGDAAQAATLASWGADRVLWLRGVTGADDVAPHLVTHCRDRAPWAVLVASTAWGREVAARAAAALGAGMTGDAIDLSARPRHNSEAGPTELVGWKPAFGGSLVAAISASTPTHFATVRPGILGLPAPRDATMFSATRVVTSDVSPRGRVEVLERVRDDDVNTLAGADAVVGVGQGVAPDEYGELQPLLSVLGAELGATRKVTDKGWLPRARQIGITGRSISPRLYVALGLSGKFNHSVGVRAAGKVLAVNPDATAPIFEHCDLGIVADWHEAVPLLIEAVKDR